MSQSKNPTGTIRVHYVFPPKGEEMSPFQVTLEQIKKYASNKPLRRGPEHPSRQDVGGDDDRTDPMRGMDTPSDPGVP